MAHHLLLQAAKAGEAKNAPQHLPRIAARAARFHQCLVRDRDLHAPALEGGEREIGRAVRGLPDPRPIDAVLNRVGRPRRARVRDMRMFACLLPSGSAKPITVTVWLGCSSAHFAAALMPARP